MSTHSQSSRTSQRKRQIRQRSKQPSLKDRIYGIRSKLPAVVSQKSAAFRQGLPKSVQGDLIRSPGFSLGDLRQGPLSQYWIGDQGGKYLLSGLGNLENVSDTSDLVVAHLEKLQGIDRPFPSEIFVEVGKGKLEEGALNQMVEDAVDKFNALNGTNHQIISIDSLPQDNLLRINMSALRIKQFDQPGLGEPRPLLDLNDPRKIRDSLEKAEIFNDNQYSQLLMAELRVRDPALFVEMHRYLKTLRLLGRSDVGRGKKYLGQGSYNVDLHPIERNIHRFWAGGPMNPKTVENILAMQEKINSSQDGPTPWKQVLWTTGIANEKRGWLFKKNNPLDQQLAELAEAGVEIRNVDEEWGSLEEIVPGAQDKAVAWTRQAKSDLDSKKYDRIKWLSDLVRLVAVFKEGGVYMDTDIGPGRLDLDDNQLFHLDGEGEIAMFGPPFRVPEDYAGVLADKKLGHSPEERIVRHANESIPALNYFLASRSGTKHLEDEIRAYLNREDLTSGMGRFGYLFVPEGEDITQTPTPYAPPQQTMIPWLLDLDWTTEVSRGEG